MFSKILIANRGEVALRIIRACKEMGIRTVAVHSDADVHSLHVRFADEAVCIGPPPSAGSYLNISRIISAAEITDAEAIHPGYGYLAENPEFAEICSSCGITFIGPRVEDIRLMGDKVRARETMTEYGLPTILGSTAGLDTPAGSREAASKVGFPLIIKARAGGGGKGMRVVRGPDDFDHAFRTAKAEAAAAFGDSRVYLERYLPRARHVEFQIAGDTHGNVVHLGERECSIQRRHQKLIEESPSPGITEKMRQEMGKRCVKAMERLGYRNVGTLEFLVTPEMEYFFLEMNTRIQVEHPVTEMVTGIDLVKTQLLIASGEPLPFAQKDITFTGHAIECRVNAEDPVTFAPSPGQITTLHFPGGPGVRVDSAVFSNSKVLPFYDSLVAKIIARGRTREEAIAVMRRALEETVIGGIKTTIPLQLAVLREKDFQAGDFWIDYLEKHPGLYPPPGPAQAGAASGEA
jgi:acetyl-CoA carboxylase biotin carboxylase subunit